MSVADDIKWSDIGGEERNTGIVCTEVCRLRTNENAIVKMLASIQDWLPF